MKRIVYTVTPQDHKWTVQRDFLKEGREEKNIEGPFLTQADAIVYARKQAFDDKLFGLESQIRIKNEKGQIRDEWTYGNDPHDIPG